MPNVLASTLVPDPSAPRPLDPLRRKTRATRLPSQSMIGHGLYILVNANAKRGGRRIAAQISRALPGATVRLTRSIQEVEGWLRTVLASGAPVRCILSAGGDGSAVTLLNALDRVVPASERFPV